MFLKDPPIIFLDEPTASLDAIATEQIKHSLDEIKQGRTVIIISHSLSQIIDADYTVQTFPASFRLFHLILTADCCIQLDSSFMDFIVKGSASAIAWTYSIPPTCIGKAK